MAFFIIPPRPTPLTIFKTCCYKHVRGISIPIDIYLPASSNGAPCPITLFIHGGGWIGSNRTDYCRPLFYQCLALNYIVLSMDYRLLPESTFNEQLEDVKDVESWVRGKLSSELEETGLKADIDKIVVVGASAGAHLALLIPKLWTKLPMAILSFYGPTNMHQLPYLRSGRLSGLVLPPCTTELLKAATDFDNPPTEIDIPLRVEDYTRPRGIMGLAVFRESIIAEFILRGFIEGPGGSLELPSQGCVAAEEIDGISPLSLCKKIRYPPIYQVMGSKDEIFQISHLLAFHDALQNEGVKCEKVVVEGAGHAFDMWSEIGSEVHENVIKPAVEWVSAVTGLRTVVRAE